MFVVAAAMPQGTAPIVQYHSSGDAAFSHFAHCVHHGIAVTAQKVDQFGAVYLASYHPAQRLVRVVNLQPGARVPERAYAARRSVNKDKTFLR